MERVLTGPTLRLRPVQTADAPFVTALRTDPALNAHLSPVSGGVADQARWIASYKAREAAGTEAYFVIERRPSDPCGLVRLYDIDPPEFTFGSFILAGNKPPKAALEAALLVFGFAFGPLDCALGRFDARRDNATALAFYRRFGARETGQDAINVYFEIDRAGFEARRPGFEAALSRAAV